MPRSPRATITASAASTIAVEVGERRRRLDLGDDAGAVADDLAQRARRRPPARTNDRAMYSTPAAGDRLGEHEVLVGRGEHLQPLARQVHARATLRAAAALDLGDDGARSSTAVDAQRDAAVAEDDPVAGVEVVEQRRVVDRDDARRCSARSPGTRRTVRARREVDAAVGELAGADLRARAGRRARRPAGRAARRRRAPCASRSRCSSIGPWLRFRRTTSTPARSSASSPPASSHAGPSVATILCPLLH